jgi:hypothetical protein
MRAVRVAACAVLLAACACSSSGPTPSPAASAVRTGSQGLDPTTCDRDERFLSEIDTEYANVTADFNKQVNGATLAKARSAVDAYETALQRWIGQLQSPATSAPFDPVRLGFLQGMRNILAGLRTEYRSGSRTTSKGNARVNQGAGQLSVAYRLLFAVSKRFCPGSFLANQSPG